MMASRHFGPLGHPRYGEYANDIVRSGRHVLDIVNDLLDDSRSRRARWISTSPPSG